MSYKTILVHVDNSRHVDARIYAAAQITAIENAHLIAVATIGLSRFSYQTMVENTRDISAASYAESLRDRAANVLSRFETIAKNMGVKSFGTRLVNDDVPSGVSLQARYADLVVLGQPDPDEPPLTVTSDFPDHIVMKCRAPAMIIPYTTQCDSIGKTVLIAWDGSEEATQAVHNAIPLLRRATVVKIAIFDSSSQAEIREDSSEADLVHYLARQHIAAEVIHRNTAYDTGKELLSLATELDSDLLVMGCFGHSRLREMLVGGTTRTILESTTIPVLISH